MEAPTLLPVQGLTKLPYKPFENPSECEISWIAVARLSYNLEISFLKIFKLKIAFPIVGLPEIESIPQALAYDIALPLSYAVRTKRIKSESF